MNLNSIGVVMYGIVMMYIFLYWIMWFFKVPYYKKMMIHNDEFLQIMLAGYSILITCAMIVEMGVIFYDNKTPPPFTFGGSVILLCLTVLCYIPGWLTSLRNKIPNRWEN